MKIILKRLFDLFWTIPGLVILLPLFGIVAIAIKLGDGGPVFFLQERIGQDGITFRMWKFRTMVATAPTLGGCLTVGQDPRITKVGAFLRKTKLDELPQLFNVLFGSMSLVGPRPEVERYVREYSAEQRSVLSLRPGITDIASIRFKNEGSILTNYPDPEKAYIDIIMPEKIRLNLEYSKNSNIIKDFLVILKTLKRDS